MGLEKTPKNTSKQKPGYHGTGSARGERAYKHCKQGESSESSKNSQRPSGRITKRSKARVARAAPESRQQARTIAYSLARALRALAGDLSRERLGRIALLGNASEILPKSLPETSREDHQEEQGESGEGRPRIETASA